MVGKAIRSIRTELEFSQAEFAEILGTSAQNISAIEKNTRAANYQILSAIYGLCATQILMENEYDDSILNRKLLVSCMDEIIHEMHTRINHDWTEKNEHADILIDSLTPKLLDQFVKLNTVGRITAIERLRELTEIERYKRKTASENDTAEAEN